MSGESLTVCCLRSCHGASGAPRDGQAAAAVLTVPTRPLLSHWASLTNHKFRGEIVKTSRRATAEFETQHGPSEEQSPRDCAGHTRDAGPGHGPPRPPPLLDPLRRPLAWHTLPLCRLWHGRFLGSQAGLAKLALDAVNFFVAPSALATLFHLPFSAVPCCDRPSAGVGWGLPEDRGRLCSCSSHCLARGERLTVIRGLGRLDGPPGEGRPRSCGGG